MSAPGKSKAQVALFVYISIQVIVHLREQNPTENFWIAFTCTNWEIQEFDSAASDPTE
jgi:hypothetical protein